MEKAKILWSLFRSNAYVVVTEDKAVCSIPTMDMNKFESVMLLGAQSAALENFKENLEEVIKLHNDEIKLLTRRKGGTSRRKK